MNDVLALAKVCMRDRVAFLELFRRSLYNN